VGTSGSKKRGRGAKTLLKKKKTQTPTSVEKLFNQTRLSADPNLETLNTPNQEASWEGTLLRSQEKRRGPSFFGGSTCVSPLGSLEGGGRSPSAGNSQKRREALAQGKVSPEGSDEAILVWRGGRFLGENRKKKRRRTGTRKRKRKTFYDSKSLKKKKNRRTRWTRRKKKLPPTKKG